MVEERCVPGPASGRKGGLGWAAAENVRLVSNREQ